MWFFTLNGSGFYTLKNLATGLYLRPVGKVASWNWPNVTQQPASGTDFQLWQIIPSGRGYWISNKSTTDRVYCGSSTPGTIVTASNKTGASLPSTEIEVVASPAGSNKLTGTTIGTGGKTAAAFDGDLKTYFESSHGWAGLDLGSPKVITELRYSPRSDNTDTTAHLCGGKFEGSNTPDFTDAVTLYQVLATKGGAGTPVLIPQAIYNKMPFRYVRFMGRDGNSLIGEVEFYGYAGLGTKP